MPQPQKPGQQGENIACKFLQKKGYILLEQDYRYLKAEIDLMMQIDNTVVIVEVKTRSSTYFGMPETFLKPQQIQRSYQCSRSLHHFQRIGRECEV
jgi:putative endonuclease